ncbi:hypothetical protein KFK09_003736 [Dendrobium nobile]|uniref:Uncharacterized protein n=1 Tax=Dendrobium nobile TaxID=94219 RepID=A0A8T3BYM8_DENNO|nr:hypothetical protein KFK09_003736 [Dendrobium nobile]
MQVSERFGLLRNRGPSPALFLPSTITAVEPVLLQQHSLQKMSPRRSYQRPLPDAEIEDLQQKIMQLKQRLSRLERRKGTECIRTDNDEGILDDHISSTPRSIESSFEIFKDSLPKSSSFPLYDEPIYDVYDDDIFA